MSRYRCKKITAFKEDIQKATIHLSAAAIRTLVLHGELHIPIFTRTLSLLCKNEAFGTDHHSLQVLCYLDRTFVGYCYLQIKRGQLQLTRNNISDHPGTYQWHRQDRDLDLERIKELNEKHAYALYVEPGFRRGEESSVYAGFGALLLKTGIYICRSKYRRLQRFKIESTFEKLPFYEDTLGFKKKLAYLTDSDKEFTFSLEKTVQAMGRAVTIKKNG